MEKQNTADFQEVSVRLRKDFQYDVAEPLEENEPESIMNMLWNLLGKVDTDIYCFLEFDIKARLIREITYTSYKFRRTLRQPETLLRQTILDKPSSVVVVHLTGYFFPKFYNRDDIATGLMNREIEAGQNLGTLLRLANITLRDYIISDYAMKRRFAFSEKELLGLPDKIIEQYLSQARPLAGMVRKPEPVPAKKYDNRYPAEIVPRHCSEYEDVKTPADAIFAVRELIQDSDREILGVINLDGWRPLNFHLSAIGSSNTTAVDSGLLLRATLLSNANAVILFHNHPSGEIEPSNADRMMTEKMRCLCGKCGITLMDHVIIGFHNDFCFSFYRNSIFDAEHRESPFQSTAEYIRESLLKERGKGAISGDMESGNIAAEKTAQTIAINKRLPRR